MVFAHIAVARCGFRRHARYRAATAAGLFTNTVFGFLHCYVLLAVYAERQTVGGFTSGQALLYAWTVEALISVIQLWGWDELARSIRTGGIVTDLCRPVDPHLWWLSDDVGRAAFHLLTRAAPPFAIGLLAFHLSIPTSVLRWFAVAASLVLAVFVSFQLRFIINVLAFRVTDVRGLILWSGMVWTLLSGFLLPLSFFPHWFSVTATLLPFVGTIGTPAGILVGTLSGWSAATALLVQAAWAMVLAMSARALFTLAVARLVTQGG